MWWAVSILLLSLWVLGMVSGAALGWWIHGLFLLTVVSLGLGAVGSALRVRAAPPARRPSLPTPAAPAQAPGGH